MATVTAAPTPLATEVPAVPRAASKPKKNTISPGISLLSGATAGAVEAAITYPFEFAKTRLQLHQRAAASSATATAAVSAPGGPFSALVLTARTDGLRAIYTGCSTLVLGTAGKAGVRFLTFDSIKAQLADADGKLSAGRGILAGMAAGAVESVVAITPTERIKTALIDDANGRPAHLRRYRGGLHALRTMVAEHGVRELYRGLLATTAKQAATSAVRMGTYNALRQRVSARQRENPAVTFALGAAAGVATVYATQPFDTVKTRTQGATGLGVGAAVRDVLRHGGLRAFWSGSSMRLGRLVLSGGIVFTVYENVASVLMGLKGRP